MRTPSTSSDESASTQLALQRLDHALFSLRRDASLYAYSNRAHCSHSALAAHPAQPDDTPPSSAPGSRPEESLPLRPPPCRPPPLRPSSTVLAPGTHTLATKASIRRIRPSHSAPSQRASMDLPPPREEAEDEHDQNQSVDLLLSNLSLAQQSQLEYPCRAPSMSLMRSSFASTHSSLGSPPPTPGDEPSTMSPTPSTKSLPPCTAAAPLSRPHPPSSFPRRAFNMALPIRHAKRISQLWNGFFPGAISEQPTVGQCTTD